MTGRRRAADGSVAGSLVGDSGVTPDIFAIATLIQSITGAKPQKIIMVVELLVGNTERSIVEEKDARKHACPVLQTISGSDPGDEFNSCHSVVVSSCEQNVQATYDE